MMRIDRFAWVSCVAWLVACSDDGAPSQGQSGTETAADDGSGNGPDDGGSGGDDDDGLPSSSTGGADDTGGSGPPADSSGGTGGTSGDSSGSSGSDSGSSGSSDSGSSDSSTTACEPIVEDPDGIGMPCDSRLDCPDGMTCQTFSGIVVTQSCQVLCEDDCECPQDLSCIPVTDKTQQTWMQCTQL